MTTPKTVLAVSPHLDDAALSAGATLAELALQGADVHICTIFSAVPPGPLSDVAASFHRDCGLPCDGSAEAIRVREDVAAVECLGATPHYAGFEDAIYRRRPDGRWLCEGARSMFNDSAPDERVLRGQVVDAVEKLAWVIRSDLIVTCAGVGGHIDHAITKAAIIEAARHVVSCKVLLWEDLPYAVSRRGEHAPSAVSWLARPDAWDRKRQAISCYASQTRMLWPTGTDWLGVLTRHATDRGNGLPAELCWPPPKDAPESAGRDNA